MTIFKDYANYIKNNPEGYWFKRKLYGFGWTPATWQGWLVTGVYFILIVLFAFTLDNNSKETEVVFTFLLPLALLTFAFVLIAYKKGEKPRWQWGKKDIIN